jgi:hypothetical protein
MAIMINIIEALMLYSINRNGFFPDLIISLYRYPNKENPGQLLPHILKEKPHSLKEGYGSVIAASSWNKKDSIWNDIISHP